MLVATESKEQPSCQDVCSDVHPIKSNGDCPHLEMHSKGIQFMLTAPNPKNISGSLQNFNTYPRSRKVETSLEIKVQVSHIPKHDPLFCCTHVVWTDTWSSQLSGEMFHKCISRHVKGQLYWNIEKHYVPVKEQRPWDQQESVWNLFVGVILRQVMGPCSLIGWWWIPLRMDGKDTSLCIQDILWEEALSPQFLGTWQHILQAMVDGL